MLEIKNIEEFDKQAEEEFLKKQKEEQEENTQEKIQSKILLDGNAHGTECCQTCSAILPSGS